MPLNMEYVKPLTSAHSCAKLFIDVLIDTSGAPCFLRYSLWAFKHSSRNSFTSIDEDDDVVELLEKL